MSLLFDEPADKEKILAARASARAKCAVRAAKKNSSWGKEIVTSTRTANRSPPPSTPKHSIRWEKRASTQPSWNDLKLALTIPSHRRRRPRNRHESWKGWHATAYGIKRLIRRDEFLKSVVREIAETSVPKLTVSDDGLRGRREASERIGPGPFNLLLRTERRRISFLNC